MSDVYGANATLRNSIPSVAIEGEDHQGRILRSYDSYTFLAELDVTDTLYMNKIPAGAKVVGIKVSCGEAQSFISRQISESRDQDVERKCREVHSLTQ